MKYFLILAFAFLTACGGGGGGGDAIPLLLPTPTTPAAPAPNAPTRPVIIGDCTVTFYGDSILWGAYGDAFGQQHRLDEPPAAALKRLRPQFTVVDKSVPSQSAHTLSLLFDNDNRTTKYVVIESGVIDSWTNSPMVDLVRAMAEYAKAEGRTVVITGFSHQTLNPTAGITLIALELRSIYDAQMQAMAAEEHITFAGFNDAPFDDNSVVDSVHPGQAYSLRLVDRLVSAMDVAAPECKA